ncbi:2Fe-2S iron-sulfur cluster-binding protein [Streptomyces yangpuensis]|uniref:2Fe-2S iron-sulfur cluster-binding protein n=1 Tax=Streptomyces yangpuensis TaxID=1648182 RepID=A0ABY5PVD1_9ACTN|nr:2Fe-2S iron-sulfur cluster-binding protein [Streptomyces yangpuensis]UUY48059.1 2Fe-2S iron-sulfur cluster-binding protein [Streptomyces yangpuensis]
MSENENENVTQGNGTAGWGWEPVPQGGEYDSDATAFVKLPQDMLDALGTGEPLAAPGHGYVPPPMIVPLGSASTDPAATGTWAMPAQWPEAGGAAGGSGSGSVGGSGAGSVGGPIPASIPIPESVAAAFAGTEPEREPEHDPGATAEWRFPEAVHEPEEAPSATGQWAVPDFAQQQGDFHTGSGLDADWSQAPATLPGGAPAPWAYLTQQPAADPDPGQGPGQDAGVLPGTDEAAAASAAAATATAHAAGRLLGGPGVGAASRAPRVLGGPGVGTALQEAEPAHHQAPHDIEAAHGPAATALAGERPRPGAAAHEPAAEAAEAAQPAEPEHPAQPAYADHADHAEHGADAEDSEHGEYSGHGPHPDHADHFGHTGHADHAEHSAHPAHSVHSAHPADTDGHGFAAFGRTPEAESAPADGHRFTEPGAVPAPDRADTDGQAPAETAPSPAEIPAGSTPTGDTADSAADLPAEDTGEGVPAEVPAYEDGHRAAADVHHEHPHASYVLRVNGADRPVTGAWIGESLLYVLRERLGLAGAKDGCSQGECGACAVQVDGRLVASCLVPAATAAGSEVRTVEGLAKGGELSDVQQALCRSGAVQCGFCIPGMAMTIHDLLEGNHAPSELETRQALCGNLCRCSGYAGVVEAVREVVAEREATASAEAAQLQAQGHGHGHDHGHDYGHGHVQAQGEAASEPRIPHQAAPGEGGIHHGGTA